MFRISNFLNPRPRSNMAAAAAGGQLPNPRAGARLHPDLRCLMLRMGVIQADELDHLPEPAVARAVILAIELTNENEQAWIVSRIMTDEDLAVQRLLSAEVQDLRRRILFNHVERRLVLNQTPEPGTPEPASPQEEGNEDCIACGDPGTVRAPCNHAYCLQCLRRCIRTSLRSEISFPPTCCRQPFNEATVRLAQRPALTHLFRQLSVEFGTPAARRIHCADAQCAAFIPNPRPRGGVVTCAVCGSGTCAACKARAHPGLPCAEDQDEEEVWRMMDENGFVGCPECGVVVSLREGCNHMT